MAITSCNCLAEASIQLNFPRFFFVFLKAQTCHDISNVGTVTPNFSTGQNLLKEILRRDKY